MASVFVCGQCVKSSTISNNSNSFVKRSVNVFKESNKMDCSFVNLQTSTMYYMCSMNVLNYTLYISGTAYRTFSRAFAEGFP